MDSTIPTSFQPLILAFACALTSPSFENFVTFISGSILCVGRHSLSRVFQAGAGPGRRKQHAAFYRFLSRAQWSMDELGKILFGLLCPFLPEEILAAVDDTLSHRSGPHLFGAGMHHDASRSTYGRGSPSGRKVFFAFGHNWVVVSIWVPLPWNPQKGLAIPILFRLYRSKKTCPLQEYRKRTELACELVKVLAEWVGPRGTLVIVGDHEYACETLLADLPSWVTFIGPMPMDAAVYGEPAAYSGRGRRRRKGSRLPSPKALADDPQVRWTHLTVSIYGYDEVTIQVKTQVCLWYTVTGVQRVRMNVTRDPSGRLQDRAYVSTDPDLTPESIVVYFSRRWPLESTFRNAKQLMGLEDPQNGWWRRTPIVRRRAKRPGPQPKGNQGRQAVERTFPMILLAYALVILWYFRHGRPTRDVKAVQDSVPGYAHKDQASFADMLAAARREFWVCRFSPHPLLKPLAKKLARLLPLWLLAA
jgi:hypothetical protein